MATRSKKGFASPNYPRDKADEARRKGGQASSSKQDMSHLGQKGGQAAQRSGNAHKLTNKERSKGGQNSPTNFANRDEGDVREIASMGGSAGRSSGHHT